MNNIIEHPWRKRRIDEAKAVVLESLRGLRRDDLSSIHRCHLDDLIATAIVHELEFPGSGVAALKRALDRSANAETACTRRGRSRDYKNRKSGVVI